MMLVAGRDTLSRRSLSATLMFTLFSVSEPDLRTGEISANMACSQLDVEKRWNGENTNSGQRCVQHDSASQQYHLLKREIPLVRHVRFTMAKLIFLSIRYTARMMLRITGGATRHFWA